MFSENFLKSLNKSFIVLILITALLIVWAGLSNSFHLLIKTHLLLLILACIFFLFSVFIWFVAWAFILKKKHSISFNESVITGFSSFFGSLTPVQLGADFLRATTLKKTRNIPITDSLSASFIVKALKFLLLVFFSLIIFLYLIFSIKFNLFFILGLYSGFILILLFALIFLLPLNKKISSIFSVFLLNSNNKLIKKIGSFYSNYSKNIQILSLNEFIFLLFLGLISWFFELLALLFTFIAAGHSIALISVFTLFVLIALLERMPVLPKGIGLVEAIGFIFLSIPRVSSKTFNLSEISVILIVYDFVRLIFPVIFSILIAFFFFKKLDYAKKIKPKQAIKENSNPDN